MSHWLTPPTLLELDAEWYYAVHLVKQLTSNTQGNNAQDAKLRISKYLQERPAFPIEIINVKESIAKIMMLYHASKVQESKVAANILFKQLNQNYKQSPHSFKFWHLGRYHLISKLYCGQTCQNNQIGEEDYLDEMFNPHHIWWLDNYELVEQTLQPFTQNRLAQLYLQKITQYRDGMHWGLRWMNSDFNTINFVSGQLRFWTGTIFSNKEKPTTSAEVR